MLEKHQVHTIISALNLDYEAGSDAQLNLISAAQQTPCVKRILPSEFNVDYDLPDSILPYPEKKFHAVARRLLESGARNELEYSYIYCGMFMDYMALPRMANVRSSPSQKEPDFTLRPLYTILDLENGEVAIPNAPEAGGDNVVMALTFTKDVARFIAGVLDLQEGSWPREMTVVGSSVTLKELTALASNVYRSMSHKKSEKSLVIRVNDIETLRNRSAPLLTGNKSVIQHFPGGEPQLQALLCDLEASIAMGGYDIERKGESGNPTNLSELLHGKLDVPISIEAFLRKYWD